MSYILYSCHHVMADDMEDTGEMEGNIGDEGSWSPSDVTLEVSGQYYHPSSDNLFVYQQDD